MIKKLIKILNKKQKISLFLLMVMTVFAMLLEVASLGLIIPFIQILIEDNISPKVIKILNFFNLFPSSKKEILLIILSTLGFLFLLKAIFLTYFSYAQVKLKTVLKISLSDKLYNRYIKRPYSFHLENNSSKLIRNVDEISFVVEIIHSAITLFLEIIVFLGILFLLLFYETLGSLFIILFFGIFGFLFFYKVQIKAKKWGEARQIHSGLRIKFLREGFRSIKEIKILQRIDEIVKIFTSNNEKLSNYELKQNFINTLPRLWLEWLVIVGFILLTLLMVFLGKELNQIVPLLALFAAASFRIMPSLTRIMSSIQKIIFYMPTVDSTFNEFKNTEFINFENKLPKREKLNIQNKISVKNISFKYPSAFSNILENLNFEIPVGSTIGIIGESGIGKTTLINIILGLIEPSKGTIEVDGINISINIENWQKQIGYVPQDTFLTDDTIRKNIAFAIPEEEIDDAIVKKVIREAKIDKFVKSLPDNFNTKVGEFGDRLSGGQRQRIAIARSLYNDPKILIFDEFTNFLDSSTEKEIINEVNALKGKKTIIMITHRPSTLEKCDKVYKIDKQGLTVQ